MFNSISARLYNSVRFLSTPGNWIQNSYNRDGKVCAIGQQRKIGSRTAIVPFLFNALPKSVREMNLDGSSTLSLRGMEEAVINYNDSENTRRRNIVNLFKRAARMATMTKGDRTTLPIQVRQFA